VREYVGLDGHLELELVEGSVGSHEAALSKSSCR